jgi:hypothetical protein
MRHEDYQMDLPASLPGSMKEQIEALAPFVQRTTPRMNGGWVAELLIPIENFITFDLNHEELAKYNLTASVSVEAPQPSSCGRIMIEPRYADVTIDYNPAGAYGRF